MTDGASAGGTAPDAANNVDSSQMDSLSKSSSSIHTDAPHSFRSDKVHHHHHKRHSLHDTHSNTHRHLHRRAPASDNLHPKQNGDQSETNIDAEPNTDTSIEIRQADQDLYVQHVIQTVELVHVVDEAGNQLELHTILPPPGTVVVDRVSGETISVISAPGASWTAIQPSAAAPSSANVDIQISLSVGGGQPVDPAVTASPVIPSTSADALDPVITDSPSETPIPASLLPESNLPITPPAGSSIHGINSLPTQNGTSISATPLSQSALQLESLLTTPSTSYTSISDEEFRSSISSSRGDFSWASSFSTSFPSSETDTETSTDSSGSGARPTGLVNAQSDSDSTGNSNSNDNDDSGSSGGIAPLTPQQKTIVGGVVGSVAGAAFLLLLVMMAIKWRKRRHQATELLGEQGARGIQGRNGPPSGDHGSAGAMVERSGAGGGGFSIPASLAALTRKSQHEPGAATRSGERGFVRVSGRKLPSVLQHGGDGFSDPRASTMSGESDYWRGSQAFDPGATSPRLALGSPMRPVSGVPIMRSGPGRQVAEHNPFADPPSPGPPPKGPLPPPPPMSRDGLGRSLTSQDGSRGSGSRFQENI